MCKGKRIIDWFKVAFTTVKAFVIKVVKTILRIAIRIIAVLTIAGMTVVPFLNDGIDHELAQWIWYPCCGVFVVLAIIDLIKRKEPIFKTPIFEFLANWGLLLVVPVFASVFVFNYYQIDKVWHWVLFIFAAIYFFLFFFALFAFLDKQNEPDAEQKYRWGLNTVKYIVLYWLYDLFYLSIVQGWLTATYFFGIIAVTIVFYNLTKAFLNNNSSVAPLLLFDFLFGVGLSVYLIYIIPETALQNIVLTITAAVYGGLLTLVGVAWTIRKGDADRQDELLRIEKERAEEERKKHIPFVKVSREKTPLSEVSAYTHTGINFANPEDRARLKDKVFYSITIKDFDIKNISEGNIILKGIEVHNKYYTFSKEEILEPQSLCRISTTKNSAISQAETIDKLTLVVHDMLGYEYEIDCYITLRPDKNLYSMTATCDDGDYTGFSFTYEIESVGLPRLAE